MTRNTGLKSGKRTTHFLSDLMAALSNYFSVFIVLGTYDFG